jgi:hypothetical protein
MLSSTLKSNVSTLATIMINIVFLKKNVGLCINESKNQEICWTKIEAPNMLDIGKQVASEKFEH